MPSNCCAPNCTHSGSSHKKEKCRMKRFPRDPERAAVWEANIRFAGRKNWVRKTWHALCECHFDKSQWENRQDRLKKLRPNAVPLVFPDSPNADTLKQLTLTDKFREELRTTHTCCAVMCHHTSKTCKLKKFPSDVKRADVWQMNIGRPGWERNSSSYVCECHFDEEQFEETLSDGVRKLSSTAVPLIFPTHVLVVHDPLSKKKWHTPKAKAPDEWTRSSKEDEQAEIEIDIDCDDYGDNSVGKRGMSKENCPKVYKGKNGEDSPEVYEETNDDNHLIANRGKNHEVISFITDHQYSKDAVYMLESDDNSQMCKNFCSPNELKEIESLVQSNSGESDRMEHAGSESMGEDCYEDIESLHEVNEDSNISKSHPQERSEVDSLNNDPTMAACGKTAVKQTQNNNAKESIQRGPQSKTGKELPVEIVATPDIWSPFDTESSVLNSLDVGSSVLNSQILKDALSFLQFMLPQKWMAVSEDGGIHAFLLSRTRAKAIQRSIFVHLGGGEVELYIHAVRLPSDHDIFQFITAIEPLTHDNLGDFVDSVINVVELFVSYKICHGVSHKRLLKEWRKYNDCILDSNLFGEGEYFQTVRSRRCSYLASKDCEICDNCDSMYQRYLLVEEIR